MNYLAEQLGGMVDEDVGKTYTPKDDCAGTARRFLTMEEMEVLLKKRLPEFDILVTSSSWVIKGLSVPLNNHNVVGTIYSVELTQKGGSDEIQDDYSNACDSIFGRRLP
jgi:hypothetical protein